MCKLWHTVICHLKHNFFTYQSHVNLEFKKADEREQTYIEAFKWDRGRGQREMSLSGISEIWPRKRHVIQHARQSWPKSRAFDQSPDGVSRLPPERSRSTTTDDYDDDLVHRRRQSRWRWPLRWGGSWLFYCHASSRSPAARYRIGNSSTSTRSSRRISRKRTAAYRSGSTVVVSISVSNLIVI